MTDLRRIAQSAVEAALKNGAKDAEAFLTKGNKTEVALRNGQLDDVVNATTAGLGLRAFLEHGQCGFAYTSDLSPSAIESIARSAVNLAKLATQDSFAGLPESESTFPKVEGIWDPNLTSLPIERKIQTVKDLDRLIRSIDQRITATEFVRYEDVINNVIIANSRNLTADYNHTMVALMALPIAEDKGDRMLGMGFAFECHFDESMPDRVAREAVDRTVCSLNGKQMNRQGIPVIFDPFTAAEFFAYVGMALSAESVQMKKSVFVNRLNNQVAAPDITLIDDGLALGRVGTAPFDGEGVPQQRTPLIQDGQLIGLLHSTVTARKAGTKSTGNAQRSYQSLPCVGVTNLCLKPGNKDIQEIIAGIDHGLYIKKANNVGGISITSGDYSVSASGLEIRNGQINGPISRVTIGGNILDMLKNIKGIGSDLKWSGPYGAAPTIRIDGLTVSG